MRKKRLFQLYLDEEHVEFLIRRAKRKGLSRAAVVREFIQREMEKTKKREENAR